MQRARNFSRGPREDRKSGDKGGRGPKVTETPVPPNHKNRLFCRTSEYVPPGSKRIGLTGNNQPSKVVWEVPYGLSQKKFEELSTRFPGYAIVQTGTECHDHPVAHTSYRIVWHNVVSGLPPGALVADIAGNPSYNEKFNLGQSRRNNPIQIDTFCKVLSAKDSIRRATRWGPMVANGINRWEEMTMYDMYRNQENIDRFSQYSHFLMNQCIYYYTFAEINRLLHINPDAVLVATIHKLEGLSGSINCGEQTFVKDPISGRVIQTNVETGEPYEHADPAPWFSKFCYADENGAFAWTMNKGCDDTYVIKACTTDPKFVPESCWLGGRIVRTFDGERVSVTSSDLVEPPPAYAVEKVKLSTSDILPGYLCAEEKSIEVTITHPKLFKTLEMFMINKPRNIRTLQDLTAKAHREVGNNTLVGSNGRVDISADDLRKLIACAWGKGAELESDMIRFVECTSGSSLRSMNASVAGKSLSISKNNVVKQVARFALLADGVRTAKTPHLEVLQLIEDLF